MHQSHAATRISTLLRAAGTGDRRAADSLMPLLYDELRRLARVMMLREKPGTLQPTALVHEAYLRVVGDADPGWDSKRHFFAAAAEAMRRILVDHARRRRRMRHGGDRRRVDLDRFEPVIEPPSTDVLELHEAIDALGRGHPRKARIAVLRCFGGLTNEVTAATLGVSLSTVERDWRFARAWLKQRMRGGLPA